MDWLPTFLAAAGDPNIKEQLLKGGVKAIGRNYKVHLDGYNILPLLTGQAEGGTAQGDILLLRRRRPDGPALRDWKMIFMEQKAWAPSGSGWNPSYLCACP